MSLCFEQEGSGCWLNRVLVGRDTGVKDVPCGRFSRRPLNTCVSAGMDAIEILNDICVPQG